MRFPTMWHFDMNTLGWACVLLQPHFKLRNSKCCSVSSLSVSCHRIFKGGAKALIRLHTCTGWSEPLLVAHTLLLDIPHPCLFLFGHNLTLFKIIQNGCHPFSPMQGDMFSAMMAFFKFDNGPYRTMLSVVMALCVWKFTIWNDVRWKLNIFYQNFMKLGHIV